ncbi:hypothetical protein C2G38_2051598, partial [Gigaspora rosea]
ISHAINRHVRLGFNIAQGSDIELAFEGICGTSVAHLEPEHPKGKKRVNTLPGNSNWFSWEWPWDDNNTGYVRARAIPNIGEWNEFTPAKLEKLQKKDIQKPNPQVSQHSVPKSPWFVPMPHKSKIHPDRLTVDQLKTQLTNRGVSYNNESTKQDLISLLNNKLSQEPELQKTELSAEALNSNEESEFPLALGWALKENQKFGKRGRGYFLAGNINKSDRYTTEEMHTELLELVKRVT